MRLHQTTIKDIARILGISASTVSRALKDHPDISAETKEAVRRVAESVNYRPNALALSLRKAKSNIIGVVIPEMSHHFFSSVLSGMDELAFERGYSTMICQSCERADRERSAIQALVDTRVDGLLISLCKEPSDTVFLAQMVNDGLPVVFFDRASDAIPVSRVLTDDFFGAHAAVSHMLSHGRHRIALLGGEQSVDVVRRRREGYEAALAESGIAVDNRLIIEADTPEAVETAREAIVSMAGDIDGLFAVNDATAIAAMKILQSAGRRVPQDVEVVGFGDDPVAQVVSPSLSSVEQNGYEMGREAMRMLIDQVEQGLVVPRADVRVLKPDLKIRESSSPA